jgi:tRNA(adenine34) deaminase
MNARFPKTGRSHSHPRRSGSHARTRSTHDRRWVKKVKTDSTHPPKGLFKEDAQTIADTMATREVSPGGIGSGIKMVQYYLNRGGRNLSASRKHVLERAKKLLQERLAKR